MFSEKRAKIFVDFIQLLNLTDDFYGQPFILQEWQRDLLMNVYGTVTADNIRQYNFAYLEIAKKNTKTTLVAGLSVVHLMVDPKDGQIFCCAADRAQASIVYDAACSMIEQATDISDCMKITPSKKEIKNKITGTTMKVLSAEAYTKHGLNPTVVIFDLHNKLVEPARNGGVINWSKSVNAKMCCNY
jgi:phage terminase large subunit-like protein